jgi:predicted transposase YdaD
MDHLSLPTNTPHNDLFYSVFSRKEKAKAFFEKYLPASIISIAGLNQLSIEESKHMSDAGLALYNDVLYKCPLEKGQIGYFFAVAEHQSNPYKHMPLRLAKYNLATIEGHLKQGNKHFPVVVNIVLYTGKKPWNYSTAFNDYYVHPSLGAQYLSMAPFTLVKLPQDTSHALYTDKDLGFCWAAFYCGKEKDAYQSFAKFREIPIFQQYFERLPAWEREIVGRYLGLCVDKSRYSLEKIVNLVIANEKEKEVFMRSVAQDFIDKGRIEGIFEVAKSMLKEGLAMQVIQKVTGLSQEEIGRLQPTSL